MNKYIYKKLFHTGFFKKSNILLAKDYYSKNIKYLHLRDFEYYH